MENKVIFDSFNARYLSSKDVADSFIKNSFFEDLLKNNHSLLMGPRGCGKTTLLKMLTPTSLMYWDKRQGSSLFLDVKFFGVYIPTDIHWKKQLDQLSKEFGDDPICKQISRASITINILQSLLKTFDSLKSVLKDHRNAVLMPEEILVCKDLIDAWRLSKPLAPSFKSLELHLLQKVSLLNMEISKSRANSNYSVKLEDFSYFDYFDLVRIACSSFSNHFEIEQERRWALCFDELEIAPHWLQQEQLQYLRSRDQQILIKVTTAPHDFAS